MVLYQYNTGEVRMFGKIGKILLALIIAISLGSLFSLMMANRTTASRAPNLPPQWSLDTPSLPYIDPSVVRILQENTSEIPIILVLRSALSTSIQTEGLMEYERQQLRQVYVSDLIQNYKNTQASLIPLLNQAQAKGDLLDRRDLWIVHGMALTVRPNLLRELMESPIIERIYLDHYREYLDPGDDLTGQITGTVRLTAEHAWGIDRVRAPKVWSTFGISGTGAVVAILDTGVDFLHPVLQDNYRGNVGKGLYNHHTSWFDAVNGGVYPYDDQGHGSHVAGTAVGAANFGVAPGAKWIGVKVLNTDGYGFDSWILDGFQWLLAPGGDASLAPDVINASWSSPRATNIVFEQVIQTLSDAGIFSAFAAGNEGPAISSVGAPASYKGVFAVGASDEDDDVATFSARGPSPWREIKPYVVAPGVNIESSIPGGVYGSYDGTSMATPHVVGLAALLRGISPTLSVMDMADLIIDTAIPLSITVPNNESGWGRIDAFDAVVRLLDPAILSGNIRTLAGMNIPAALVVARSFTEPGLQAQTLSDEDGRYTLALNPGYYDLEASAFGYYPHKKWGIEVSEDSPVRVDFVLPPQPVGSINGHVYISGTGQLVTDTVTLSLAGTPLTTTLQSGSYHLVAPQGTFTLTIREVGYRVVGISVTVQAGEIITHDIYLTPAPKLLLVDEGVWYYGSQRSYWMEALDALRYTYDVLPVKYPPQDTPTKDKLLAYDLVLWSSPRGAPSLVGGAESLQKYLAAGGLLLISGQEIAYFDAGGTLDTGPQAYLYEMMGVSFVSERTIAGEILGQGPYMGLVSSIHGGDGADNQVTPDIVRITNPDIASLPWIYDDSTGAGSAAAICTPYRALFFGFGFEAISSASLREKVMQRSLDWLTSAPLTTGLAIKVISDPVKIGSAGTRMTHTLDVRHIGILGKPEIVTLTAEEGHWPYEIVPNSVEISPCTSITVNIVVTVPYETGINTTDWLTLTALSSQNQASATVILTTKTPAPVLLVDDDRWYPVEKRYTQALDRAGIFYDVWDNQDTLGGIPGVRSPLTGTLNLYPILVWFTGYDWYDPINDIESNRLLNYLGEGGRLILSSQDFLYYHESDSLARRLGIQAVSDGDDIMVVQGTLHPSSGAWQSVALDYPFPLHTDIVEPIPAASLVLRGQVGQPLGIATELAETGSPATLFYGLSLEALPTSIHADILSRGVGWLSPLGQSDWRVTPSTASAGDTLTYTLVLRNSSAQAIEASAEHYIPDGQNLLVSSLPSDLIYSVTSQRISWRDQLTAGQVITYVWETQVTSGTAILSYPTITLSIADWGLTFDRLAPFYGKGPELNESAWLSTTHQDVHSGSAVTLSFLLHNSSDEVGTVHASVWIMEGFSPLTVTPPVTEIVHGWSLPWWTGELGSWGTHTLTLPLRAWILESPVRIDALLSDERGNRWELPLWINVVPRRFYLPLITR
jgi:subtilisin family serine protease